MPSHLRRLLLCALVLAPATAAGQTTTYHLHLEGSLTTIGASELRTGGPDYEPGWSFYTSDLRNQPPGEYPIRSFDTVNGELNVTGLVPAGSTVTFSLWMQREGNVGTVYPRAKLFLNSTASTLLCSATAASPLTVTLAQFTFMCTTSAALVLQPSDRYLLWVGANVTAGVGDFPESAILLTEGSLGGTYDSTVVVPRPPPAIADATPNPAPWNTVVHITGTEFGATQGASTVRFNGTLGVASAWSSTELDVPVPAGSTTGPITVTVGGTTSSGFPFTVIPPPAITSLNTPTAYRGDTVTITGANFSAIQGSSTVRFNGVVGTATFWSDTSISAIVPPTATSGQVVVTVAGNASNSVPLTVYTTGTLNGTITRVSGGTPLTGATIQAVLSGIIKSTATSAANGTYAIPSLDMGTYDVRVHASGYSSDVRSGTVVPPNATTVVDVAMAQPGSVTGKVTQLDGTTPIPGAAVTLFAGGIQKGSASTNGSGDYTVSGLHPGPYTLQAAYVGYQTKEQGTTVPENANTAVNISLGVMPAGPVQYVYDELGRLVTVIDAAGDAATYTYDAVGNILSIGRIAAGTVAITEFTPNAAPVGATATIYGTGFSATPAQNTLTFNGTAATITSSTTTQIVTTVPAGATTGPIAVTTPLGSASSGTAFTVQAATGVPSISSFSPTLATVGTALAINGANFDPVKANNRVLLHQTFAALGAHTPVLLSTEVPHATTSGRITVSTPNGTATSVDDLYIPPPGFVPADVAFTSRLAFGSPGVVASITPANKIGLLLFDATPTQRVSFNLTQSTFSGVMKIFRPSGTQASSTNFTTTALFIEATSFAEPGTHVILLDPNGTATGTIRVSAYDVVDLTGTIAPTAAGTAVPITIATPGQIASLTFAGAANQKVSALYTSAPAGTLSIRKPDGLVLVSATTGAAGFIDAVTLPTAGTYSLRFDPTGANTGSITVTFYDVVDTTTSMTPTQPGASVAVSTTTPGQRALATFTATAGQRVSVQIGAVTIGTGLGCRTGLSLLDPAGATVASNSCVTSTGAFLNVTPALTAGPHTIVVDPLGSFTGGSTLTAYDVPADWTGSITPGSPGSPVTVTIDVPGQNAILSFNGTNGQRLSLSISANGTSSPGSCTAVTIRKPDGLPQASLGCVNTLTAFIEPTLLTVTGPYTILIDPAAEREGSMTLALHSVVDDTGSIAFGSATLIQLPTPGQTSVRSFTGTNGQRVSLGVSSNSIGSSCTVVTIRKPDGSPQATNNCVSSATAFIEPTQLVGSGEYSTLVNPAGGASGNITLTLSDVPADVTGTLTINAAATPVALGTPGQNASFTFSGTLNQLVTVRITSNTFATSPCVNVRLFRQDGTTQLKTATSCAASFNLLQQTLPATETYIVKIDPAVAFTGSLGVRVTDP